MKIYSKITPQKKNSDFLYLEHSLCSKYKKSEKKNLGCYFLIYFHSRTKKKKKKKKKKKIFFVCLGGGGV